MLNEPTHDKLRAMRLLGMAQAWDDQQKDPEHGGLGFDERFSLLVDAEALYRENRRLSRLLREARLRITSACVEDLKCSSARGLERSVVRQLMTGRWVDEHHNLLVTGATDTGKTYVACAFAQHACRNGRRAIYRRLSLLLEELMQARASGTYAKVLKTFARTDVLVLDDWGLAALDETARRDMLEILDDRYGRRSTIVAGQLAIKHWHDYVGEPTVADAILDRLVHNAHKIELQGPSLRSKTTQEAADH